MRLLRLVALLLVVLSPASARAAGDEAALRRRVERFYVLSYLDRHGEMWEMFTPTLQHQLGDDRATYARSARSSGFELFASRIDAVSVRGAAATVDVAIQVQLPGTTDVQWRRHRMAWQLDEDHAWLYAGSLDITHEEHDVASARLEAQPSGGMHEESPDELLPLREPKAPPEKPTLTPPPRGSERWDLVAIPPPQETASSAPAPSPPPPTEAAQREEAPPAPGAHEAAPVEPAPPSAPAQAPRQAVPATPAPATAPVASPTPPAPAPAPAAAPPTKVARLEPPERAAPEALPRPPSEPPKRGGKKPSAAPAATMDDAADPINILVRRVALASGLVRMRAIEKLRVVSDPAAADLMVSMIDQAGPESAAFFLERIAVLGRSEHAAVARTRLDAPEAVVRGSAARVLGELGNADDIPALVGMMPDETESSVTIEVLRALGLRGGHPVVVATLADESRSDVERAEAAHALVVSPSPEAEPVVVEILGQRAPRQTFLAAIDTAGRLGTPPCVEALERLVADGGTVEIGTLSRSVRLAGLRALVRAETPRAGERLAREMSIIGVDAVPGDVDLVAESGDDEALLSLLGHVSAPVRRRAAELSARVIQAPDAAAVAAARLDEALVGENDNTTLIAIHAARERLRAAAQGEALSAGTPERR